MPRKIIFSEADVEKMKALYAGEMSCKDIADAFGCAKNTVRAVLIHEGVQFDRAKKISAKMVGRPSHRKGVKMSDQQKQFLSKLHSGNKYCLGRVVSEETREKLREKRAAYMASNPNWRDSLRAGLTKVVRKPAHELKNAESIRQSSKRFLRRVLNATGKRKEIPSEQYLGYSTVELVAHLGNRPDGAHIDHYVPIAEFVRRGIDDPAVINALTNLRWMPGIENQRKSDSVPPDADAVIQLCVEQGEKMRRQVRRIS